MKLMLKYESLKRLITTLLFVALIIFSCTQPIFAQQSTIDVANSASFQFVVRDATEQDITEMNVRNIAGVNEGDEILVIEMKIDGNLFHTFYTNPVLGSIGYIGLGADSFAKITDENFDDRAFTFTAAGGETTEIEVTNVNRAREFFGDPANGGDDNRRVPGNDNPIPADDDNADDEESEQTCEENFDFTGAWIVCMALGIIDQTVDNMVDAIADMLSVGRAEINDDGLKTAWSYFRNIASVLLVVIGLVMIIGQAVSKE